MSATWPASLPAPLFQGDAADLEMLVAEEDFEVGWQDPRLLAANLPMTKSASFSCTSDQLRDFTLFIRDHAEEWTVLPLHVPGSGEALTSTLARIASFESFRPHGARRTRIVLTLELPPA